MSACKSCGDELVVGARFCRSCGAPSRPPKHSRPEPPPGQPRVMTSLAQARPQTDDQNDAAVQRGASPQHTPDDEPPVAVYAPDATSEMAALSDEQRGDRVFAGASLQSLAQRSGRSASRQVSDDRARRRALLGLAGFVGAATLIVLLVVIFSQDGDGEANDDEPAEEQETAMPLTDLSGSASITAAETAPDSVDWAENPVTYSTANLVDDDPSTAWRMEGDGTDQELTIEFDQLRSVSEVGLINGYAKVDPEREDYNWYDINRRLVRVTWIFDDGTEITQNLDEVAEMQVKELEAPVETQMIRLRLDEVSSPGGRDYTAISEVTVSGRG